MNRNHIFRSCTKSTASQHKLRYIKYPKKKEKNNH